MAITLTLNTHRITASPPVATLWNAVQHAGNNIAQHKSRIGELKRAELEFTASKSVYGFKLYLNPAIFIDTGIGVVPSFGLQGTRFYFANITGAGSYTMSYNAMGAPFPNIDKLYSVLLTVTSPTTFIVFIYFYQACDNEGYLEPTIGDNHSRLLKDKKSSTSELTVSGQSVYTNSAVDLRYYVYMENASVPSDLGYHDLNPMNGFGAGFYAEGKHGAASYFSDPTFNLTRSSNVVTSLSAVQDTTVGFNVKTSGLSITHAFATIIRSDKFDNTVDPITNYDLQQVQIDPAATASSKLKNFVAPIAGSPPGYWTMSFDVDKTALNIGEKYRLIVHVYHNNFPADYEVDAFISDEFVVDADVPYTGDGFSITGRIGDCLRLYAGNYLTCVIEERMRSQIFFDTVDDYGIETWKRDIYNRLGLTVTNDIRRYLTRVKFTIYESATYKNILLEYQAYKTGPTSYTAKSGILFDFTNPNQIKFEAQWRNLWDAVGPNIQSYDLTTGVAVGPQTNQYWGGKSLFCEWEFEFYYDDYTTPFTDKVVTSQIIVVNDYSPCVQIGAQNPPDDSNEFWCPEDNMCLKARLAPSCLGGVPASNYYLITNIDFNPGSDLTIEETEMFATQMTQLQSPKILSQETAFSDTETNYAKFCVDVTQLTIGSDYKISAIAKEQ